MSAKMKENDEIQTTRQNNAKQKYKHGIRSCKKKKRKKSRQNEKLIRGAVPSVDIKGIFNAKRRRKKVKEKK